MAEHGKNPEFLEKVGRKLTSEEASRMGKISKERRITYKQMREAFESDLAVDINTSKGTMSRADALRERVITEALKGNFKFVELAFKILGMTDKDTETTSNELVVRFVSSGIIPASSEEEVRMRDNLTTD